jgi:hypothetical protein
VAFSVFFCLSFGPVLSLFAQQDNQGRTLPEVEKILAAALEVAEQYQREEARARFTHRVRTSSEKLDGNGEVVSTETTLKDAVPIQGFIFEELVEKDGRPLNADEKKSEEKRKQEFLKQIREGQDPNEAERQRVFFDQKLIDKYHFDLLGVEERNGRQSFILAFKPKADNLPVETRMDRALNKAEGQIWIDCEEYEISYVHFELRERIRIWWGLIGSISKMRGTVERTKVSEDIWLPSKFDIYLNGRIFFRSLHRQETIEWSDFRPIESAGTMRGRLPGEPEASRNQEPVLENR